MGAKVQKKPQPKASPELRIVLHKMLMDYLLFLFLQFSQ